MINGPVGHQNTVCPSSHLNHLVWLRLVIFWKFMKNFFIGAQDPDFLKTTDRPAEGPFSTACYAAILDHEYVQRS